jgi:hypothetical protein
MSTNAKKVGPVKGPVLYEHDYYGWILDNVHAIRERRFEDVDWLNVAEELEDMGKSERRAFRSQLARLLAHLLKWSYEPEGRRLSEHSWRATIAHARKSVRELADESLSFKPQMQDFFPRRIAMRLLRQWRKPICPKGLFPPLVPGLWTR